MNLIKVSAYSAVSQATSLIAGLVAVKILAVQIGPEGVALQSQFLNSVVVFALFSTGAIGTGIIKYVSEYFEDRQKQLDVIRVSLTICLCCSVVLGLIICVFSKNLAISALLDASYYEAYLFYGIFLPITALNILFSSFLNGLRKIRELSIINIITSVTNLCFLIIFSNKFHFIGILIYANFSAIVIFLIHLYIMHRYKWFSFGKLKPLMERPLVIKLFKFSVMTIFAGLIAPISQIIIRNKLIRDEGLLEAGEWQTVMRISDFYLSFLIGILSVYLLPKLSSLVKESEIRNEILKTAKLVLPVVVVLTVGIWLARDVIITVLLTEKFRGIKELFSFQLLGDIFKIAGWGLSMILWARAKTRLYLMVDGISLLVYLGVTILSIEWYGTMGATIGFFISYVIYFFTMVVINRKYLFKNHNTAI